MKACTVNTCQLTFPRRRRCGFYTTIHRESCHNFRTENKQQQQSANINNNKQMSIPTNNLHLALCLLPNASAIAAAVSAASPEAIFAATLIILAVNAAVITTLAVGLASVWCINKSIVSIFAVLRFIINLLGAIVVFVGSCSFGVATSAVHGAGGVLSSVSVAGVFKAKQLISGVCGLFTILAVISESCLWLAYDSMKYIKRVLIGSLCAILGLPIVLFAMVAVIAFWPIILFAMRAVIAESCLWLAREALEFIKHMLVGCTRVILGFPSATISGVYGLAVISESCLWLACDAVKYLKRALDGSLCAILGFPIMLFTVLAIIAESCFWLACDAVNYLGRALFGCARTTVGLPRKLFKATMSFSVGVVDMYSTSNPSEDRYISSPKIKKVRWADSLVSSIRTRPRTLPEDVSALFYSEADEMRSRREVEEESCNRPAAEHEAAEPTQEAIVEVEEKNETQAPTPALRRSTRSRRKPDWIVPTMR